MRRRNRGQVLVFVALAIFVLLGFAALAIDLGYMYSVRHELQRCADAGALAGASVFRDGSDSDNDAARVLAIARATDYATRDNVVTSLLNTVPGDVVQVSFPKIPNNKRVQVDVQRTVPTFFARVFRRDNEAISALAVAEAFPVTKNVRCVVPWGIPAPWTNITADNSYNAGDIVNWPPRDTDCDGKAVTSWDYSTHSPGSSYGRDQFPCQGSLQTLKIGDSQESGISGNFYGIDLSTFVIPGSCPEGVNVNAGADFYRYMIKHPCLCKLNIDLNAPLPPVPTEPGMMVGPTLKATGPDSYFFKPGGIPGNADNDSIMNGDPTAYWDTSANMPVSLDPRYAGDKWSESPRVVRIPIYNPDPLSGSPPGVNTPPGGSRPFQPLGFIGFWVQDIIYQKVQGKELGKVVGRFVTVEGYGTDEGDDSGGTVLNIRLVK